MAARGRRWATRLWLEYLRSYRTSDIAARCKPSNVLLVIGGTATALIVGRSLPELASHLAPIDLAPPLILCTLSALSFMLCFRWRNRRRAVAGLLLLVGVASHLYTGLLLAADSWPPIAFGFAGFFVLFSLHWGRFFSVSSIAIASLALGPAALALYWVDDLPTRIIAISGSALFVWTSWLTSQKRTLRTAVLPDSSGDPDESVHPQFITTSNISVWNEYLVAAETGGGFAQRHLTITTAAGALALAGILALSIFDAPVVIRPGLTWHPVLLGPAAAALVSGTIAFLFVHRPSTLRIMQLIGTACISTLLAAGASLLSPPAAYGPGVALVFFGFYWARHNRLNPIGLITISVLPLAVALALQAPAAVKILLLVSGSVVAYQSWMTGRRRATEKRRARSAAVLERVEKLLSDNHASARGQLRLEVGAAFHKLKNELGPTFWNLSAAHKADWSGAEAREALEEAYQQIGRTMRIVEQQLRRIRASAQSEVNLFWLPETDLYIGCSYDTPASSRIAVEVQPTPAVAVSGSVEDLRLIVINLIDNAVEAGASAVRIESDIQMGGTQVVLRIVDNGPGIPSIIQHKLFDPFFTHAKTHGTGLGLYLARCLAEGMDGSLCHLPQRPGGTAFEIVLPIGRTAARGQFPAKSPAQQPQERPADYNSLAIAAQSGDTPS